MDILGIMALVLRRTREATIVTYAILVYEFLIMLDREYESIYKSRWSASKCLYLACRFGLLLCWPIVMYSFIVDHELESCKPFIVIVSILFMLFPCFPQCLYVLRAYAITGAKRWSLLIYLPCFIGHLFIVFWYSAKQMTLFETGFLILGKTACFPVRYHDFPRMLIAVAALDAVIGIMLVIHFIREGSPQTRLGNLIITQSILYFVAMFLLYAAAAVVTSFSIFLTSQALVLYIVLIIPNVMACRFIIQIKECASNNLSSFESLSRVRREAELAFSTRPLATGTDSVALSGTRTVSKV